MSIRSDIKNQLIAYVEEQGFVKTSKFIAETSHIWAQERLDILDAVEELIRNGDISAVEYGDHTPGTVSGRVKQLLYSKYYGLGD